MDAALRAACLPAEEETNGHATYSVRFAHLVWLTAQLCAGRRQ